MTERLPRAAFFRFAVLLQLQLFPKVPEASIYHAYQLFVPVPGMSPKLVSIGSAATARTPGEQGYGDNTCDYADRRPHADLADASMANV